MVRGSISPLRNFTFLVFFDEVKWMPYKLLSALFPISKKFSLLTLAPTGSKKSVQGTFPDSGI